jgi:hypothetical protein
MLSLWEVHQPADIGYREKTRLDFCVLSDEYGKLYAEKNDKKGNTVCKLSCSGFVTSQRRYDMNGRFQVKGGKTGFCRKRLMQTGSLGHSLAGNLVKPLMSLNGPNGASVAMDSEEGESSA